MSKFHLVLTNIGARNVGSNLSKDQQHKQQLVQVNFKGKKIKTESVGPQELKSDDQDGSKMCTNWEEEVKFELEENELQETDVVKVKIFQKGKLSIFPNKLLGKVDIPLEEIVAGKRKGKDFSVNLNDGNNQPTESMFACILSYTGHLEDSSESKAESKTESKSEYKGGKVTLPQEYGRKKDQPMDYSMSTHEHVRRNLSNKELDFQIKVKVIEARQLEGGDINPVVRLTIGNEKKQTRVKQTTNRPRYNQTFSFNFISTTFRDLFDKQIKIEVFDSHRYRSDALLGFYKCDIGAIYDLKGHILLRKWVMLSEPQESEETKQGNETSRQTSGVGGAPAGFVKVSMVVVEADFGDNGISAPSLEDNIYHDVDDDIESNLLQLPGVTLTPAVFTLKIYRAEDLPQMDPKWSFMKAKEWVDPYCVFSFAGKKAKSEIMYDNMNPDFKQQLNIPFQFPSICDKINIQLMDYDRLTAHDHIGAIDISLPSISGDGGTGFLPTFGPCFVNVYGSPREFSEFPTEHDELNKGKGEGVAYRGRVLVELETKLNSKSPNQKEPISELDIVKVKSYMHRQKFRLLATFLEATMLSVHGSPVEFEMSIGNYGNKLDKTVSPCPCSTPPTNPVFDGEKYYYLPWGNSKPYMQIDCQWEDITFRLRTLNRMLNTCNRLEKSIESIRWTFEQMGFGAEYEKTVYDTLERLSEDCRSLRELDPKTCKLTRLDMKLQETRKSLLSSIAAESDELRKKICDGYTLPIIEGFLKRIKKVSVEPQNSMPDVIVWMIKKGKDRVAYCRIPAHELLYTPEAEERGVKCGKIIDINFKYPGENNKDESEFPALLRVMFWFGLPQYDEEWEELKKTGGELAIYAEMYENQSSWLGHWSHTNLNRPSFSNANGTVSLPKDDIFAHNGWKFDSNTWKVVPELSTQYAIDVGCEWFLEDAFENEYRSIPGGNWHKSKDGITWTQIFGEILSDEHDEPIKTLEDIKLPEGWKWFDDEWKVDVDCAVDNEGWEYTVETSFGATNYEAAEKLYHFCRRRRWIKKRQYVNDFKDAVSSKVPVTKEEEDGWEYAMSFKATFHRKCRGLDIVRRRRLHKKLIRTSSSVSEPLLSIGKGENQRLIPPSIFLCFESTDRCSCSHAVSITYQTGNEVCTTCHEPHMCQLRAYLFQGRNLLPSDADGLADPYVQLSFGTKSATSKTVNKKLNPTWDQMLVLQGVPIYGSYGQIVENPPDILLELFDRDNVGKNEFLGRVQVEPFVLLPEEEHAFDVKLSWHKVFKGSENCGDVLAAFELFLDEDLNAPSLPQRDSKGWFPIPPEIHPVLQRTAVEVLCWGLRNLGRYRWRSVKSPYIEVEIGDKILKTSMIKNFKANPNFQENLVLYFDADLPRDDIYTPPVTIRLKSNSLYGQSIIGVCVVDNLHQYRRNGEHYTSRESKRPGSPSFSTAVSVKEEETQPDHQSKDYKEDITDTFDWWSKYYASQEGYLIDKKTKVGKRYPENYDRLKIYPHALENEFDHFKDFIKTFHIRRAEKIESFDESDEDCVGEFKGNFSVYSLPNDSSEPLPQRTFTSEILSRIKPVSCLVRVYIVRAYELSPRDNSGLADPYLVVSLGDVTFDDKQEYQADSLNCEFGKVFEFNGIIPVAKDLKIKVMDFDRYSLPDLIGETTVDLESRLLTRRHATVGLPATYNTSGPSKWRLGAEYSPTIILQRFLQQYNLQPPRYIDGNNSVVVNFGEGEQHFSIDEIEDEKTNHSGPKIERLALHVLNSFKNTPFNLVPEHVETRELLNDLYPGFSQGKLEMFIDIFPETNGIPSPPVDISPRIPKKYELRVIVWNTKDVQLQETSFLGDEMSDIFVKCKLNGVDEIQKTDVHYRSFSGDGMFNWRMTFPFDYSDDEELLIVKKKAHFYSRRAFQEKLRPELVIQVWDNDLISRNDFIGSVKLDLQHLATPFANSKEIKNYTLKQETRSLFRQGSIRGWWPVEGNRNVKKSGIWQTEKTSYEPTLTGKVELTLELLKFEEAKDKPVGKGQEDPNAHPFLEKPHRPETSFLWITNPFKSLRYILWRHYKWYIIGLVVIILLILFVALFIYAAPGYTVKKIFNA